MLYPVELWLHRALAPARMSCGRRIVDQVGARRNPFLQEIVRRWPGALPRRRRPPTFAGSGSPPDGSRRAGRCAAERAAARSGRRRRFLSFCLSCHAFAFLVCRTKSAFGCDSEKTFQLVSCSASRDRLPDQPLTSSSLEPVPRGPQGRKKKRHGKKGKRQGRFSRRTAWRSPAPPRSALHVLGSKGR